MKTADQICEEVMRERRAEERQQDFRRFEAMYTLYKQSSTDGKKFSMDDHVLYELADVVHNHFGDHYDVSAKLIAYEKMEVEYKAMKKAIEDKKTAQKEYYEKNKKLKKTKTPEPENRVEQVLAPSRPAPVCRTCTDYSCFICRMP
jgi:hypothetical protein